MELSSQGSMDYVNRITSRIPGTEWIDKLKFAFNEADKSKNGKVTRKNFVESKIKYLLSTEEEMTDKEINDLFDQINSSGDDTINWYQFADFVMAQQQAQRCAEISSKLDLEYEGPPPAVWKNFVRGAKNIKSIYVPTIDKIVALTERGVNFWDAKTCTISDKFVTNEVLIDMAYISPFQKLALAQNNRKII